MIHIKFQASYKRVTQVCQQPTIKESKEESQHIQLWAFAEGLDLLLGVPL